MPNLTCRIGGCETPASSNGTWGMCQSHFRRLGVEDSYRDRHCDWCGSDYRAKRYDSRFCGLTCKKRCYYSENSGEYRDYYANHRQERIAYQGAWSRQNTEALRLIRARRRARIEGVPGIRFTSEQEAARIAYFGGKCWMCGALASVLDHVKPIAKGGGHMLSNLRPACQSCNLKKHAKWYGPKNLWRFACTGTTLKPA